MDLGSKVEDYHFDLDERLIAQRPIEPRDSAKLLIVRRHPMGGLPQREEALVRDLPEILQKDNRFLKNSLWVRNRSRVFPARFYARRASGSVHEIVLIEEFKNRVWKALIKRSARMKFPESLHIEGLPSLQISVLDSDTVSFNCDREELIKFLERHGEMPLPPYIKTRISEVDSARYQSVWARGMSEAKSAAAPTASLHFTEELCRKLEQEGVQFVDTCLHVGLGTFEPLRQSVLDQNHLHSESFSIASQAYDLLKKNFQNKDNRAAVLCVGTTALRLLESLPILGESKAESFNLDLDTQDYLGRTQIFIKPGFEFRYCDALFTNFHLPASSLLVLLSCFAGSWKLVKESYEFAQSKNYRFFSYGDACLWL